jgi:hypothetical protein
MSSEYFLLWALLFCVGVVVGVGTASSSMARGGLISLTCGAVGILEFVTVTTYSVRRSDINILPQIASVLFFGFVLWGISLFFVAIGYFAGAFFGNKLSIASTQTNIGVVALVVVLYFAIAAVATAI